MDMCPYIVLRKCVQEFAGLEILEQLGGYRKTGRWASELERRSVLPPRLI
jgi:hypothetical protein